MNQGVIASKGGARLLANTVSKTEDPQTLRMVAGAIANLCGNGKFTVCGYTTKIHFSSCNSFFN